MHLTDSQARAVSHDGPNLQLIACAGSGKTEVVARRIVHLLNPQSPQALTPSNIIAFTYTDKAAGELSDRIVTRCREAYGSMTGLAEMFVGTIHAFCLDLLKTESPEHLKYEVLNEVQQRLFVDRHSRQSGLTTCTDLQGRPLRRFVDSPHYINALSILREANIINDELIDCSILEGLHSYRDLLVGQHYLDYSAILEGAARCLRDDKALRARLADRVRYLIVDEYQDVNPIQEEIVRILHDLGAHVCVVGDDDQTIYQWRGSDVENILSFKERYPTVASISLEENFRSSEGVVETARVFVEQNAERLPKAMRSTEPQPYEPGDIVALSLDAVPKEAAYIVATARSLRGVVIKDGETERGISWSDMAVLLRSVKANGEPITDALRDAKIPYIVAGMTNLFETEEAEASRQLFYFLGGRSELHDVEAAWAGGGARSGIECVGECSSESEDCATFAGRT